MSKTIILDKFCFSDCIKKYTVTFSKVEKAQYNYYYLIESNNKQITSKIFNSRIQAFLYFDFLRTNYE